MINHLTIFKVTYLPIYKVEVKLIVVVMNKKDLINNLIKKVLPKIVLYM